MDKTRAKKIAKELTGKKIGGWTIRNYVNNGKSAVILRATRSKKEVALKIFDPDLVDRFGREAQLARVEREKELIGKRHPNLIEIIDGGECRNTGYIFVAMAYLPEKNLSEILDILPRDRIFPLIRQIASAAKFLDEMGLTHRDIKPDNIAISDNFDHSTLLDLGVLRPVGLLLCAEEAVQGLDRASLQKLADRVEARIEEGSYFYPARVPWCTARVLMGLGRCGRNVENSEVVRRSANWLMKSRKEGGAREGSFWVSGTGTWNTNLETTAMCLIALREVGVPVDEPILIEAKDWLYQQKKVWTEIGLELDGAIAIEAYLKMNRDWREVFEQITYLSWWAVGQAVWMYATESANKTKEQSCRVAQLAAFLIKAMWSIIRNDLPGLLTALGVYRYRSENTAILFTKAETSPDKRGLADTHTKARSGPSEWDIALSFAGEDRKYVESVAKCLERAGVKVFYDKFEQVDLWGKDLYTHLDEVYRKRAKFCVMFLSADYARKAWTNHERKSAQARAFQENQEYILPVRMDDTEVPGISPLMGYIDGKKYTSRQLCKMILKKLQVTGET